MLLNQLPSWDQTKTLIDHLYIKREINPLFKIKKMVRIYCLSFKFGVILDEDILKVKDPSVLAHSLLL